MTAGESHPFHCGLGKETVMIVVTFKLLVGYTPQVGGEDMLIGHVCIRNA